MEKQTQKKLLASSLPVLKETDLKLETGIEIPALEWEAYQEALEAFRRAQEPIWIKYLTYNPVPNWEQEEIETYFQIAVEWIHKELDNKEHTTAAVSLYAGFTLVGRATGKAFITREWRLVRKNYNDPANTIYVINHSMRDRFIKWMQSYSNQLYTYSCFTPAGKIEQDWDSSSSISHSAAAKELQSKKQKAGNGTLSGDFYVFGSTMTIGSVALVNADGKIVHPLVPVKGGPITVMMGSKFTISVDVPDGIDPKGLSIQPPLGTSKLYNSGYTPVIWGTYPTTHSGYSGYSAITHSSGGLIDYPTPLSSGDSMTFKYTMTYDDGDLKFTPIESEVEKKSEKSGKLAIPDYVTYDEYTDYVFTSITGTVVVVTPDPKGSKMYKSSELSSSKVPLGILYTLQKHIKGNPAKGTIWTMLHKPLPYSEQKTPTKDVVIPSFVNFKPEEDQVWVSGTGYWAVVRGNDTGAYYLPSGQQFNGVPDYIAFELDGLYKGLSPTLGTKWFLVSDPKKVKAGKQHPMKVFIDEEFKDVGYTTNGGFFLKDSEW